MDYEALRHLLRPVVGDLKDLCTNSTMPELCAGLGLPWPPDGPDKRGRLNAAFDLLADKDVPALALRLIARGNLAGKLRNEVQELLWAIGPPIELPKRTRRELAKALQCDVLFHDWLKFKKLLNSLFLFKPDLSAWLTPGDDNDPLEVLHSRFAQNARSVEWLFDELEVYELSDNRFRKLLEGIASADVQREAEHQATIVATMNSVLQDVGSELREVGQDGGYPLFELVSLRVARGRPKNLIFASTSKPDIRFRDAVNNDIEIASHEDEVLVYDRPLGSDGLRWRDLQAWWADARGEPDAELAKSSLYRRLRSCLPASSPPQQLLFQTFFKAFGPEIPNLPALLPEVWLHWDPKTVKQRGAEALLTHRMDFLMLMPGGGRVVIEVDGQQHYARNDGRADPRLYAHLAAGHRQLALAGYDVYRFAGIELSGDEGRALVTRFLDALFARYGVR